MALKFKGRVFATILGCALVLAPLSASATTGEAMERLAGFMFGAGLVSPDLNVRGTPQIGSLAEGEWISYRTALQEGIQYHVVAAGCDNALDIDVGVSDGSDTIPIALDLSPGRTADAVFVAPYTGWYTVGIKMVETRNGGAAHVAHTVLYRAP